MVKGITRQAVVVRTPDPELFEQAIFIVRCEVRDGVSQEDILRQAQQEAGRYVAGRTGGGRWSGKLTVRLSWLLTGAAAVGLALLTFQLLDVRLNNTELIDTGADRSLQGARLCGSALPQRRRS